MQEIHLYHLPIHEFSVRLTDDYLDMIYKLIKDRFKKVRNIIPYIQNCSSIKKNIDKSAKIYTIFAGKRYIPCDLLIRICKILNIDIEEMEKHITLLAKNKYTKKPISLKFPLTINEEFVRICEIIRTEGYISPNLQITLSNSDMRIINNYIDCFKIFSLKKRDFYFRLYTKICIPNYVKKEDIQLYDVNDGRKINNFSFRTKILKNGKKKEVHIYDSDLISFKKKYKIVIPTRIIDTEVDFSKEIISSSSSYIDGKGKNITSSLCVTLSNHVISKLLHYIGEIPLGKKSSIIRLPQWIQELDQKSIKAAFEEAINCDGHIERYQIKLKSISKGYLEDWKKTLDEKFGIKSTIRKHDLVITHKENFEKIVNNFAFLSEKNDKLRKMASGKKVLHPRTALTFYKSLIEKHGPIRVSELSQIAGKTKSCIKKITKELYDKGLVRREKIDGHGTFEYYASIIQ